MGVAAESENQRGWFYEAELLKMAPEKGAEAVRGKGRAEAQCKLCGADVIRNEDLRSCRDCAEGWSTMELSCGQFLLSCEEG